MKKMFLCFLFLLCANAAHADYILSVDRVGSGTVSAGNSLSFDVVLSMASGSASFDLSAIQAAFDFHKVGDTVGNSLPSGLGAISISNYLNGFAPPVGATNPDFDLANDLRNLAGYDPNFDFNVNVEKITNSLTLVQGTQYRLFQVTIDMGSLTGGNYELTFQNDQGYFDPGANSNTSLGTAPFTGAGDPGGLSPASILSSQFTVNAVPEPTSLALVGLAAIGLIQHKRRRRVARCATGAND